MGDGVHSDVNDGSNFGPTCKTIHAGEDVAMTSRGWQGADKVNVDVVESLQDGCESAAWRVSVPSHLGGLTVGAGASPV